MFFSTFIFFGLLVYLYYSVKAYFSAEFFHVILHIKNLCFIYFVLVLFSIFKN
jgi:hypothetical protein